MNEMDITQCQIIYDNLEERALTNALIDEELEYYYELRDKFSEEEMRQMELEHYELELESRDSEMDIK
jgi:hypothetical protein